MTTAVDKINAHDHELDRLRSYEVPLGVTLIESVYTTSASATITLPSSGSISQKYNSLYILGYVRTDRSGQTTDRVQVTFDGDSSSNYDYQFSSISGSLITSAACAATGGTVVGQCSGNTAPANVYAAIIITIPGYALTTNHKTLSGNFSHKTQNNSASFYNGLVSGWWRSASAIESMAFSSLFAANIAASSWIGVYGIY